MESRQERKSNRPRVLMLTSVYPRWKGDATPPFVQNLAERLVAGGLRIRVLAPHSDGAPRKENWNGVEIRRFSYAFPTSIQKLCYEGGMLVNLRIRPWTRLLLPFFFFSQIHALRRELKKEQWSLVHSHSLLPQGYAAALLAPHFRLPHLTTSHGNDVFGLRPTGLMGYLKRKVLREADAITVNSEATRAAVVELGSDPHRVIRIPALPNGAPVDPSIIDRLRKRWNESGPVILFAGRLIAEKGIGVLLEAGAFIAKKRPIQKLVILGEGTDREHFERMARDLGLAHIVEFAGWIDGSELPSWMAAADVVAVPSRPSSSGWKEAQGLVAAEAMAAGTPVVASAFGGLVDMVEDGVTGYLCPPNDATALANCLQRALEDPERSAVARRARERYEREFSPEAVCRATETIYRQLLEERPE